MNVLVSGFLCREADLLEEVYKILIFIEPRKFASICDLQSARFRQHRLFHPLLCRLTTWSSVITTFQHFGDLNSSDKIKEY
jgi:hypothetical protein